MKTLIRLVKRAILFLMMMALASTFMFLVIVNTVGNGR